MRTSLLATPLAIIACLGIVAAREFHVSAQEKTDPQPPTELAEFFRPPEKYRNELGSFRSPLKFADGTAVKTPQDWQRRLQNCSIRKQ